MPNDPLAILRERTPALDDAVKRVAKGLERGVESLTIADAAVVLMAAYAATPWVVVLRIQEAALAGGNPRPSRELVTTYLVALISLYLEAQLASIITDLSGEQHVHP